MFYMQLRPFNDKTRRLDGKKTWEFINRWMSEDKYTNAFSFSSYFFIKSNGYVEFMLFKIFVTIVRKLTR